MRFLSLFSGIEAASVAWKPLGWDPVAFAEIEPFPCSVLQHHYPDVPNWGDVTKFKEWPNVTVDLVCGGSPCFTAGHVVLTDKGYRNIETISPGDMVITHKGRLRRVARVGSKTAEVGMLRAVGMREPIITTPDHPFLSVDFKMQNTRRNGKPVLIEHCGEPEWIKAENMPGRQWCALTEYEKTEQPKKIGRFTEKDAMYIAGMYLGDGHIRRWKGQNKKAVVLSLNDKKMAALIARVDESLFYKHKERTSTRATICDTEFCNWLLENFGEKSHSKIIPAWVLGHKFRADLLQGYIDTDGCTKDEHISFSTTSKALAYGIADVLNAEGFCASVSLCKMPSKCIIEGRIVNQRDFYSVRGFSRNTSKKSRVRHGYLLRTVQGFERIGTAVVYNLEVEDDHTFILNGGVVHNCQSFSLAGLRKGLDDPRGNLMLTFGAVVAKYRPRWIVYENVPGLLSSNGGRDFGAFLAMLAELGYGFAYRVLDAQYVRVESHPRAVPQRRRRVFVVGHIGGQWQRAAAVLFERESLLRNSPPRRTKGEDVAGTFSARTSGGGGFGTDFECSGGLLACYGGGSSARLDVATTLLRHGMHIDFETETFAVHGTQDAVFAQYAVRRLMPTECEKLMGFPVGYTDAPHKGKPAADGNRYKALGNSWAVNCARWIGERIAEVDQIKG